MAWLALITLLTNLTTRFVQPLPPLAAADIPRVMPDEVKAIYITSQTAKLAKRMAELRQLIYDTELNAVVINTKEPFGPRIYPELKVLVDELHKEGLWVIARHVVFQDDELAERQPELSLKRASTANWQDRGGHGWVDPANREVWEYNLDIAQKTLELGFDEINLDYIRFPTDGDLNNIIYPSWDKTTPREEVLRDFLHWFKQGLRTKSPYVVISIDVYGETFLRDFAGSTGQRMTTLAPEVDVVSPMVYPSHYRSGNFGYTNPATQPYGVVYGTLEKGQLLFANAPNTIVRPWLQDFHLGAQYTPAMVRAQITATTDAGNHNGWMLWNPKNIYSESALLKE
ncbi:MAG: hypothetical protein UW06_C0011G0011 [Parcubacteria group bacterium GW2011_GWE1_43_8]|nr:MAG: hypothetical protein UW06_C0011G0011 [Parcubacteria group bacterium GW2011_GWE1_43_8]